MNRRAPSLCALADCVQRAFAGVTHTQHSAFAALSRPATLASECSELRLFLCALCVFGSRCAFVMSTLKCAISGVVCLQPVISARSGYVFERELIEKYLQIHGKCPLTGEPLSTADLIAVKSAVPSATANGAATVDAVAAPAHPPRAATAAHSIPELLRLLQSEWDASALEVRKFTALTMRSTLVSSAKQSMRHDAAACLCALCWW